MVNLDPDMEVERKKQLLYEVADTLKSGGCGIAEILSGLRVEEPQSSVLGGRHDGRYDSMGILVPATFNLFGIIPVPFLKRWAYPADLWIDNTVRGAIPDERWVLDVYGSENVDNSRKLMQQIAEPYGVEVIAKVIIDEPRWEGQELYYPIMESQASH